MSTPPAQTETSPAGPRVLVVLLVAYIFNFIDRQIIGVLAVPIKAEFGLSDTALSYARGRLRTLLRDDRHPDRLARRPQEPGQHHRRRRSRCGACSPPPAASRRISAQLVLARMGVAFGEAGGIAPSYALISDFYPEGAAGPGARLLLARNPDRLGARRLLRRLAGHPSHWRAAFLIVGLAGLPAALLVKIG